MTIIDTSVVTKWYFLEEKSQEALKLRNLHQQEKIQLAAPILLLFELGNVCISKGIVNQRAFSNYFSNLLDLNIKFIQVDSRSLELTFINSIKYKITFYDATYIALARGLRCNFITADKRLYQATKTLKFVKLL